MNTNQLSVALIQRADLGDYDKNLEATLEDITKAASGGAKLVVLQELFALAYFCQIPDPKRFDLAETIPGRTTEALASVAKSLDITIVGSIFERATAGMYHNTAVVLDGAEGLVGSYRKMHIPDDPGFQEKYYFTPGSQGFKPIETSVGKLGVLVCWDQWFPEAARAMALEGADMLIYPTAIGWDPTVDETTHQQELDAWITIQRAHAIANGLPVLSCNRVGFEQNSSANEPGIAFWGNSFVAGQQGEFLAHAGEEPTILETTIDRNRTDAIRRIWPYFRDRRVEFY